MVSRVNSDQKFKAGQADQATNHRQTRSYEYFVLQQTNFELYRTDFHQNIKQIRNMRLMQHLGRYIPLGSKVQKFREFKQCFAKVMECMTGMLAEAAAYKALISRKGRARQSNTGPVQRDEELSFKQTTKRYVKEVQALWLEVFEEGSLKRLLLVLAMLGIQSQGTSLYFQINQWGKVMEANLCVNAKQGNTGCCDCLF